MSNRNIIDDDVVISGVGTVSPFGNGTEKYWNSLSRGEDAIGFITKYNMEQNYAKLGGQIDWYSPTSFFSDREIRRWDINTQYALIALKEAMEKAAIGEFPQKTGIFIGTLTAGLPFAEEYYEKSLQKKYDPWHISQCYRLSVADNIAKKYSIIGPRITITTACSASAHAISLGANKIRKGELDIAVVGGVDAFCKTTLSGFSALRALSEHKIAPFSYGRSGTQIGEGAGVLILESYKNAKKRNAPIYAVVKGWGASSDAYHVTAPNPSGITEALAMKKALNCASLTCEDVDIIVAHGTGTHLNDLMESNAIKSTFGEKYKLPYVTSIKSMIGHTMGAAGVHSLIAAIGMLQSQTIYPTINFEMEDKECDVRVVKNTGIKAKCGVAMINAFGFGGNNASLLIKRAV